jgi:PhnB protein
MSNTYTPDNFHTVTPALVCKDAAAAIEFYKLVFGAEEILRLEYPQGGIAHAELMIGDSPVMLSDEHPDMNILSPQTIGNSPVGMHIYVPDADAVCARAVEAGAKLMRPVTDQFYGDRVGHLEDPFGHKWSVATAGKPVSKEELLKLWDKMVNS